MIIPRAQTVLFTSDINNLKTKRIMLLFKVCRLTNYEVIIDDSYATPYISHRGVEVTGFINTCLLLDKWYPEKRLFFSENHNEDELISLSQTLDNSLHDNSNQSNIFDFVVKTLSSKIFLMSNSVSIIDIMIVPIMELNKDVINNLVLLNYIERF